MVSMSSTWSTPDLLALGFPDPDTECEMPDLGELRAHDDLMLSLEMFTHHVGQPKQRYFAAWMNLVRLTGKALRGYQAARVHLAEYRLHAYECRIVPYYRAVDNLEDAIAATHRGFLAAQRLTPVTGRKLPQPTRRQTVLLRTVHDYIDHADERLIEVRAPAGELYVVVPRDRYVEVASVQLPYQDLAWCITKLHRGVAQIRAVPG
jgi:hypothetical protein